MSLKEQLKKYYNNTMASSDAFYFGQATTEYGLSDAPIAMTQRAFKKSTVSKHNVPRRVLNNLAKNLSQPMLSFKDGSKIAYLINDIDGDGKQVLVAVDTDAVMDRERVNAIDSIYGIDSPECWIANQANSGKEFMLYNEKEANAFLQTYGYLASVGESGKCFIQKISQQEYNVNAENEKYALSPEEQQELDNLLPEQRLWEDTANKNMHTYGYTHPELRQYYEAAARQMYLDVIGSLKGTRFGITDSEGYYTGSIGQRQQQKNNSAETGDLVLDESETRLYDDIRAYLVERGIPAEEIAFIHEAKTDAKKKQLFADMNDGKVRVLIGSTGKMGVGMNAQERIVAIHHLDAPWRPGDVEQRDGRAFRQKNMNAEVSKYVYVTTGSFDARMWDILDRKQHFINQIMNGEDIGRSAEDTGNVTLSAAEVKAIASGNPLIAEQVTLTNDLAKLHDLKRAHTSSVFAAKEKLLADEQKIGMLEKSIENCKADIKARVDTYSEGKFSMTVGKSTFTEKKDAGAALAAAIISKAKPEVFTSVGRFAGFELRAMKKGPEYIGHLTGHQAYRFNVYTESTTRMVSHIAGVAEGLETRLKSWESALAETKADLEAQNKLIAQPFAKQEELNQKISRYNEVMAILNPKEEQAIVDEDEDDGTQYQRRRNLEEEPQERKKKRSSYSETETLFMQWENGSAQVGEVKQFYRFGKLKYYEKTENGCVELSKAQFNERTKQHVEESDRRAASGISKVADINERSKRNETGRADGNGDSGGTEILSGYTVGEELRDDTGRSVQGGRGNSERFSDDMNDTQHQRRVATLSDRAVLSRVAHGLNVSGMTEAQKGAFDVFRRRIDRLGELELKRMEQGKLYHEQQFGENVDREEAKKTLNRMR